MKFLRKITILLLVSCTLIGVAHAEDTKSYSYKATIDFETGNVAMKEEPLTGNVDYSSLMVNVTKTTSAGVTTDVYTGPLSGYDGGIWSTVDFSEIQGLLLFDWESEDSVWIVPVSNDSSAEISAEVNSSVSTVNETENLMPISSNLALTSHIKLNGMTVNEQGMRIIDNANMSCTLAVSNSSTVSDGVTAILATYTSTGKLHNIKTFEVDVAAGQTKNIEIVYQFDAENEYTGKLMFWNTMSNLMPIRASIDFSQTSGINAYYYNSDNRLLKIDKANGKTITFTYDNMGNLLSKTTREWGASYEGNI